MTVIGIHFVEKFEAFVQEILKNKTECALQLESKISFHFAELLLFGNS